MPKCRILLLIIAALHNIITMQAARRSGRPPTIAASSAGGRRKLAVVADQVEVISVCSRCEWRAVSKSAMASAREDLGRADRSFSWSAGFGVDVLPPVLARPAPGSWFQVGDGLFKSRNSVLAVSAKGWVKY
jgi:hypothetical protein